MEDVRGMVHEFLKGTVKVGECFGTASKPKALAEIVTAFGAIRAAVAHDASLNSNSLSLYEIRDAWPNRRHDAGGFVTED
jgi:hypothetical protein